MQMAVAKIKKVGLVGKMNSLGTPRNSLRAIPSGRRTNRAVEEPQRAFSCIRMTVAKIQTSGLVGKMERLKIRSA